MNIHCTICSDLFTPTAEVFSTTCGHMFHYTCLIQWIERSKTCPQCRNRATEKTIHRVYFNFLSTEGINEDVCTLQSKLDNIVFQMKLKDKDIKIYTDKCNKVKEQNLKLREEIKSLENKERVTESAMHAFKEQIQYFKQKSKDAERLTDEIQRLKEQIKHLDNQNLVMHGTREQVNDMLKYNKDPEALSLLVTTLKRELVDSDRKKKQISSKYVHLQNEYAEFKKTVNDQKDEIGKLREELRAHENCEKERRYLKNKILSLQQSHVGTPDVSIKRIINESPAPANVTPNSHSAKLRYQEEDKTTESYSPYLKVKSSGVGISKLLNTRFMEPPKATAKPVDINKYSLFKQPLQKLETVQVSNANYSYDGLGGHSKVEIYPNPIKGNTMKRPKSSSALSSNKFRKLAPNSKLDNYVIQNNSIL